RAALLLALGASSLVMQTPLDCAAAGPRPLAQLRGNRHLGNHFPPAPQAIASISLPVALTLAGEHDPARPRDARGEALKEAATHVPRKGRARRRVPAEHRLGCDLVDVLPARSRALHELKGDLSVRDSHCPRSASALATIQRDGSTDRRLPI